MGGRFKFKKSFKPPKAAPPAPAADMSTPNYNEVSNEDLSENREARKKAKRAENLASGRKSSILTGALGDSSEANVMRKTLLGQ